jgi:hypothetical protein
VVLLLTDLGEGNTDGGLPAGRKRPVRFQRCVRRSRRVQRRSAWNVELLRLDEDHDDGRESRWSLLRDDGCNRGPNRWTDIGGRTTAWDWREAARHSLRSGGGEVEP